MVHLRVCGSALTRSDTLEHEIGHRTMMDEGRQKKGGRHASRQTICGTEVKMLQTSGVSAQTCFLVVTFTVPKQSSNCLTAPMLVECGAARRRRDTLLRMHWRHEQLSLRMLRAFMGHHSWQSRTSVGIQTDDGMLAATCAATAPAPTTTGTEDVTPSPAVTCAAQAPVVECVVLETPEIVNAYVVPAKVMSTSHHHQQCFILRFILRSVNTLKPSPVWITRKFLSQLLRLRRSLIHFLSRKILPHPCTTKSIRNRSLHQHRRKVLFRKLPVPVLEWIQELVVETIDVLPQERVEQHTAKQIVHVPISQIQEQSAVTGLVNLQFPITAVQASQVVGSFSLSEDFAAPAEVTTLNTSSTSTSSPAPVYNRVRQKLFDAEETTQNPVDIFISSSTSTISGEEAKMFDNLKNIEKRTERVAMFTKRMMEIQWWSLQWWSLFGLLRNAVDEHDTPVAWDHGKCSVPGSKRAAACATRLIVWTVTEMAIWAVAWHLPSLSWVPPDTIPA